MSTCPISTYSVFNIQGLNPQSKPSKVPYIRDVLIEKNQLFVALTETWLGGDHLEGELEINGYELIRSDRERPIKKHGRLSGGVCLYIRNEFYSSFKPVIQFTNGVVELLAVYSKTLDLCILVMYRQPDQINNRSLHTHFSDALKEAENFLSSLENCPTILLTGDFNLPHVKWYESGSICLKNVYGEEKKMFLALDEFCLNYSLSQKILAATHIAGNTLDLVFTNDDVLFHSSTLFAVPRNLSHHKIIEVNVSSERFTDKSIIQTPPKRTGLYKYNFFDEAIDWKNVNSAFAAINWETEFKNLHVDEMAQYLINTVEEVCDKFIPLKSTNDGNKRNKIPRNRRVLMRRRRKLNVKLQKLNQSSETKEKLTKALVDVQKMIIESQECSRRYQENKAIDAIKKNSKYFFSYVNKLSKVKTKVGPLCTKDGLYTSDSKEMADILSEQFSSVYSPRRQDLPQPDILFPLEEPNENTQCIMNIQFTVEDIIAAIKKLSSSSAPGPDGFPTILLKNCAQNLASALFLLYRKSLDCGLVPTGFKLSNIVPIFKSGDKGVAVNYRPVALTSHLSKVFERVICSKLVVFLEETGALNESQHGFRKGRSCISQLLEHFETVINFLDNGYNVDVVYLDFCKAFDKLDFNILLQKLKRCGVGGYLGRWLYSFISGRLQYVTVNGFKSFSCEVLSGVPQGSVLGPLLFILMISDIDADLANSFLSSFADDTRIGMEIKSLENANALQADLNKIYDWTERNNMVLNPLKFELLQYGKKTIVDETYSYLSNTGDDITSKDVVKDLGVLMSSTCNFTSHIDSVVAKVKKLTSWAFRNFKSRTTKFIMTTWKSLILPIIDYASQLWNPSKISDINHLEMLQKCFVKKIQYYQDWSYWDILRDLGLFSLQRRRERYRIIYLWSILEGLVPNPSKNIHAKYNLRIGRTCSVPTVKNTSYCGVISSSFSVQSATLFNRLPKKIRDMTDCGKDTFKKALDVFFKNCC